jgi:hypothetical protein
MLAVSGSDLAKRFDVRDIQELVVDDDIDASIVDITTDTIVSEMLDDARGEVVAALRRSGRYNDADLEALSDENAAYLKRIVCEIAMLHLLRRRPRFSPGTLDAYEKIRAGHLKDLQDGNSILSPTDATELAGRVNMHAPTVGQWNTVNMAVDLCRRGNRGYFPERRSFNGRE